MTLGKCWWKWCNRHARRPGETVHLADGFGKPSKPAFDSLPVSPFFQRLWISRQHLTAAHADSSACTITYAETHEEDYGTSWAPRISGTCPANAETRNGVLRETHPLLLCPISATILARHILSWDSNRRPLPCQPTTDYEIQQLTAFRVRSKFLQGPNLRALE